MQLHKLIEKQMKNIIKKHKLSIIGAVLGALGGFAYYHFVGCNSGSCPITSNPYMSIFWGAIMGYLLLSMFEKKEKQTTDKD